MFTSTIQSVSKLYSKETNMCMTGWTTKALKARNPTSAFSPSFKVRFIVSVFFSEWFTLVWNAGYIIQPSLQDLCLYRRYCFFQACIYCVRFYFMCPLYRRMWTLM